MVADCAFDDYSGGAGGDEDEGKFGYDQLIAQLGSEASG